MRTPPPNGLKGRGVGHHEFAVAPHFAVSKLNEEFLRKAGLPRASVANNQDAPDLDDSSMPYYGIEE